MLGTLGRRSADALLSIVVAKGRILIVEDDEWERSLLEKLLKDAGFEVGIATSAQEGLEKAITLEPDCIICDVILPDIDGFYVARRIRTEQGPVSTTPFLFLTGKDDHESKLQGFNVGADAYMTKPYRHDEVVAQVDALITMARRLQVQRESFFGAPPSGRGPAVIKGDIGQMSIATVLTVLEMERRTGRLTVSDGGGQTATIELKEGALARVHIKGQTGKPADLTRQLLLWKTGAFSFRDASIVAIGTPQPIGPLLLEAMKLEDEANR